MATKKISCPAYLFYEKDNLGCRKKDGIIGLAPIYKTKLAACADIAVPMKVVIPAHKFVRVDLWLGFEIPEGYKIIMYPRSSLLDKKGLMQPTSIIDADYSGQRVHAPLFNMTDEDVVLEKGERVAQIECVPRYDCDDWLRDNVDRGFGGFGSTGSI